jgi:hypothetical protein
LFQVTLVVEVSARSEAISTFVERVKSMQFRPVHEHEDGGGPEVFVSRDRLIVTIVVSDGPWESTFDSTVPIDISLLSPRQPHAFQRDPVHQPPVAVIVV